VVRVAWVVEAGDALLQLRSFTFEPHDIEFSVRDHRRRLPGEIDGPERILRVDLDGDGEEEVLISATNYFTNDKSDDTSAAPFPEAPVQAPRPGSYSIVILRRVVSGNVQTKLVAGEVYAKPDESVAPNVFNLAAILDLNGDGKLEVIVHSFYYEGGQTTIYLCEPDKIEAALSVECGA